MFKLATERAVAAGLPLIYVAANSGARIGVAEEVNSFSAPLLYLPPARFLARFRRFDSIKFRSLKNAKQKNTFSGAARLPNRVGRRGGPRQGKESNKKRCFKFKYSNCEPDFLAVFGIIGKN